MSKFCANAVARIVAEDPRADGGQRQILIASDSIAIDRRVSGVRMRFAVPVAAFRGVALAVCENARGVFYRVALEHVDPDLSVTLEESADRAAIGPQWKAWAEFFKMPRLTSGPGGRPVLVERHLGALLVGEPMARRRGWPLKGRRSRISARRTAGAKGRALPVFRDEREIVCYE